MIWLSGAGCAAALSFGTSPAGSPSAQAHLRAATEDGEPSPAIYLVRLSDRYLRELAADPTSEGPPLSLSWTPDAKAIVFARLPCDGCSQVRLLRVASPGAPGRFLGSGRSPSLSRDGKTIVFVSESGGIYAMQVGTRRTRLVLRAVRDAGAVDQPRLSPDGRQVVFAREGRNGSSSIDVVPSRGGPEQRLTPIGLSTANPAWSPDGKTIALAVQTVNGQWRIQLMNANGRNRRFLQGAKGSDSYPTWSPDGRRIAFVHQHGNLHSIYVADISGGRARKVTPDTLDAIQPSWSPRGDQIAFVANAPGS